MDKHAKIYVTGHRGMVGSALVRRLQAGGYHNILTRSREQLDLLDQQAVHRFLAAERPDYIFIAAAKVGGIQANNLYRADFIYQNLMIEANLVHGAHLAGVQRLMFLGSSCIYPRDCPQPIKEDKPLKAWASTSSGAAHVRLRHHGRRVPGQQHQGSRSRQGDQKHPARPRLSATMLAAKIGKGGVLVDVKCAFDAKALTAESLNVWRL